MTTYTTYRKLVDGTRWNVRTHQSLDEAMRHALDWQHADNRPYDGTPYPYYIHDGESEQRADALARLN